LIEMVQTLSKLRQFYSSWNASIYRLSIMLCNLTVKWLS